MALLAYRRGRGAARARPRRLDDAAPRGLINVYADAAALALAALAIFVEPVGYLAVAAFVFLLAARRGSRASASTRACGS